MKSNQEIVSPVGKRKRPEDREPGSFANTDVKVSLELT